MIAHIRGRIIATLGDTLVLDVAGVGYEVTVSSAVRERGCTTGAEISCAVATEVKETSITLFGFKDFAERETFMLLRRVKGVGPKLGMAIISFLGSERLYRAIGQSDVTLLSRVSGVGKKTAQRLILELREQVGYLVEDEGAAAPGLAASIEREAVPQGSSTTGGNHDAILALERLGFSSERARNAVEAALKSGDALKNKDSGEILRRALAHV